jgi:hypothetical protein
MLAKKSRKKIILAAGIFWLNLNVLSTASYAEEIIDKNSNPDQTVSKWFNSSDIGEISFVACLSLTSFVLLIGTGKPLNRN